VFFFFWSVNSYAIRLSEREITGGGRSRLIVADVNREVRRDMKDAMPGEPAALFGRVGDTT